MTITQGSLESTIRLRNGPLRQFLLLGDSITQDCANQESGFALMAALQNAYIRRLDVINRGFSGYNTKWVLEAMPHFMPTPEQASILFMTVFLGANDACLPGTSTGQHVPLMDYQDNLRSILNQTSSKGQQPHLILITPPPIDEYLMADTLSLDVSETGRTAANTKLYAEACKVVGIGSDVAVLDLWSIFMSQAGWRHGEPLSGSKSAPRCRKLQELLTDGLHLSGNGYRLWYNEMMQLILKTWPSEMAEGLMFQLPAWDRLV